MLQQSRGFAQTLLNRLPPTQPAHLFGKDLGRQIGFERGKDGKLFGRGQTVRCQRGVLEKAFALLVLVEEQIFIRPVKVKGQGQGLAHPNILEQRQAQIKDEALTTLCIAVGQQLTLDIVQRIELVAGQIGRPDLGGGHLKGGKIALLKGLAKGRWILVVLDLNFIEIVPSLVDRQVLAPPVGLAREHHRRTWPQLFKNIRPRANRLIGKLTLFVDVLWQDRQLGDDQRELGIFLGEGELDGLGI